MDWSNFVVNLTQHVDAYWVDILDGSYSLGLPAVLTRGEAQILGSPMGVQIFTARAVDPDLRTEMVHVTLIQMTELDAVDYASPGVHAIDVDIVEECCFMAGFGGETIQPSPAILGPGRWRVVLHIEGGPVETSIGDEDVVKTVVEHHALIVIPLDAAAKAWRAANARKTACVLNRDEFADAWFIKVTAGTWTLTSDAGPLTFSLLAGTSRVAVTPEGLGIVISKRGEIEVGAEGKAHTYVQRKSQQLHAEAALPAGAGLVLRCPDGELAEGLPVGHEGLVGPARVLVSLYRPDPIEELYEFGSVTHAHGAPFYENVQVELLLD